MNDKPQRCSLPTEASSQRRTGIRGLPIALSSCQSQVLCPTRKSCLRQTSKTRRRNDLSYNKVTSRLKWRRDSGDVSLYRCRSIASITGLEQVSIPHNLLRRYFWYNSHNLTGGLSYKSFCSQRRKESASLAKPTNSLSPIHR